MSVASAANNTRKQIHTSLKGWQGGLSDSHVLLFRAFVEETLARIRGPFLAQHPAKQVLQYLELAFAHALEREPAGARVELRKGQGKSLMVLCSMDDQPFIVDTIRLFLKKYGADYWGGFNLTFEARRDAEGRLIGIGGEGAKRESLVLVEADGGSVLETLDESTQILATNLKIAQAVVEDFKPMTRAVERYIEKLEVLADRQPDQTETLRETAQFLKWLLAENFVFMGVDAGEPLGIQRVESSYQGHTDGAWPTPHDPGTVCVRKSSVESPVHRAGRIDEILITPDNDRFQTLFVRGMFTYRAVTQPCRNVPILRRVLGGILGTSESVPGSFRYKGIANGFDSLPTEFLFTAPRTAIRDTLELIFESEQQQDVGVTFLETGPYSAFCLIAMPKGQFGDELRRELERDIVQTLSATYSDHGVFVGRYDTVLLHFYLTGVDFPGAEEMGRLQVRIREMATPWISRLWRALNEQHGEQRADELSEVYGLAFPDSMTRSTSARRAVADIEMLEGVSAHRQLATDLFEDESGQLVLRLYQAANVYLSDILPVLDNFGLVVRDSYGTTVDARGGQLFIDTFHVIGATGVKRADFLSSATHLTAALEAVFAGLVTDDGTNRLVLAAGLTWQEVEVIRSYVKYCRQLKINVSHTRMRELLLIRPDLCQQLIELWKVRFDPDLEEDRDEAIARVSNKLVDQVRLIQAHDEDLLFSTLTQLVMGTVRTNYYRNDTKLQYLSFKVDCSQIDAMGSRRPLYEIFMHNKDVEGVHIRFGMVARGGLRWSDRDDYRTEVMGLATTQVVKNVVIVPVGAKGGFMLKDASRDPAMRRMEADRHYQTFIRGLLDLTDNAVGGKIVPPPRVVRHDGDDPYLVVAADKGTAHLSDTANKLSIEYGFWLGDAFASGGSNGYDHKGVAITARGAWVLARRHFAEMQMNPYEQEFTVAGIGDMGGDVFGNGLCETPHARLLAAFNHIHVFLDPNPDTSAACAERRRLFKLGRGGGWNAYNTELISEGGGVFDRRNKSIPLSPQVQELLGIDAEKAAPEVVIRRILQMEVDLLWNGGIGTYVKATAESDADADDRSNDALRVSASELRCKVIGEGGNLGMTQKARIEAALLGVRLNTDFIDNSAGVDMSDHEVNLKILLDRVVEKGSLSVEARNTLLEEMTDEVAELVLANNDTQGRQLSRDRQRSIRNVFEFGRTIDFICKQNGVHRKQLFLPGHLELAERAERGEGLTRPELAVMSSWMKMYVFGELLKGKPSRIPGYRDLLDGYFPKRVQKDYSASIHSHMLKNEIAMTMATTRVIADAGVTFYPLAIETTGRAVPAITNAYLKAQVLAGAATVRTTLEELRATVSLDTLNRCWVQVDDGARGVAMHWLSSRGSIPKDDEFASMVKSVDRVFELQASAVSARDRNLVGELTAKDIPESVALHVAKAQYLNTALMIHTEAKKQGATLEQVAVRHLAVARASRMQDILDDLATRPAEGFWEPIAMQLLRQRYTQLLRQMVARTPVNGHGDSVDMLTPALEEGVLKGVRAVMDEFLEHEPHPAMSTLLVLEERLAGTIRRLGK